MAKPNNGTLVFLKNGIITGLVGAATTTAVIAAYGKAKTGDPWTPFNGIAHMFFGENAANRDGFVPRETLVGLGLNGTALVTWGVMYEAIAGKVAFPRSLLSGGLASFIIYLLDYHIFPPKLRPGFEKRLGYDSVFAAYLLLAVAFGLSPFWKGGKK
ncbi:MAG: hypothetical protein H7145_02410 [Akkermansiaceae bacterium]|nr:hypothetical protein [Armatimonadota bacterium]